jgi:hypothetical protein
MNKETPTPKWHCNKCKIETETANIMIAYRGVNDIAKGLKCPKCGTIYIPEETATESIAKLEEVIDKKEA